MTPFGLYNNECTWGGGPRCKPPWAGGSGRGMGRGVGQNFNIVVGMVFQMGSTFLATLWFPLSRVAFAVDVAGHLGAGT